MNDRSIMEYGWHDPNSRTTTDDKRVRREENYAGISVEYCDSSTTFTVAKPECKHLHGTYRTIPARFWGRRKVLVCGDCESVLDAKTREKV